jgi:hypothetical protein
MGYGYGQGSWVFVVIVLAMVVLRTVARRRSPGGRRSGRSPYGAPMSSSFQAGGLAPPAFEDAAGSTDVAAGRPGHTGIPAGWMVDPSGRHQQRYWSGTAWTEHVTDDGISGVDPPPGTGTERPD